MNISVAGLTLKDAKHLVESHSRTLVILDNNPLIVVSLKKPPLIIRAFTNQSRFAWRLHPVQLTVTNKGDGCKVRIDWSGWLPAIAIGLVPLAFYAFLIQAVLRAQDLEKHWVIWCLLVMAMTVSLLLPVIWIWSSWLLSGVSAVRCLKDAVQEMKHSIEHE